MASIQPLWPACSQNRAGLYMPDTTSRMRFSSVFPKKTWITLCKTDLDPIWMAWSGFRQTHLFWKQVGGSESSGPVSGRMQPARHQFPTVRLGCILPQVARIISCTTSLGPMGFWLTVSGFGPNGSGTEASLRARMIRPTSGQCFQADPDPIWFWLSVSGLGQMDPVQKQASVQESSSLLLANASQPIQIRCGLEPACLLARFIWLQWCAAAPRVLLHKSRRNQKTTAFSDWC